MKKKISSLLIGLLFGSACATYAQYYEDDSEIIFTDEKGKKEKIEFPPTMNPMYNELDSLLSSYHAMTYLGLDETCDPASYSPEYGREVYIERLQRMSTVIEMPYNEIVRRFIDRYVRMRRQVSAMLGASNFYMPIFEQALESYGVPLELKYLPVIESALNPKAVSRVGATGLWQFMLATGKQYGLRVNSLVDDRRDPIRSSYAAARYLRDLHRIFNDWTLALAAYNCGPENVNRAIRRSGGQRDYWQIYPYLPAETRGYVPAFIAANYIMTYYCEHNICPMSASLPEHTDTIVVTRDLPMRQIAQVCDVDINMLRELNPQYRRDIVNGNSEPATLRMPIAACNKFAENEETIYSSRGNYYQAPRREVEVSESRSSRSGRNSSRSESSSSNSNYDNNRSSSSSSSSSNRYGRSGRYGHNNHQTAPTPPPPPATKRGKGKHQTPTPPPPPATKKGKHQTAPTPPPPPAKKGKGKQTAPTPPAKNNKQAAAGKNNKQQAAPAKNNKQQAAPAKNNKQQAAPAKNNKQQAAPAKNNSKANNKQQSKPAAKAAPAKSKGKGKK